MSRPLHVAADVLSFSLCKIALYWAFFWTARLDRLISRYDFTVKRHAVVGYYTHR